MEALESVAGPAGAARPAAIKLPLLPGRQFPTKVIEVFLFL
jgi:hypothetical protein